MSLFNKPEILDKKPNTFDLELNSLEHTAMTVTAIVVVLCVVAWLSAHHGNGEGLRRC